MQADAVVSQIQDENFEIDGMINIMGGSQGQAILPLLIF
jgi:hypothetical protein